MLLPPHLNLQVITYTLTAIAALFVCGFWLALIVCRTRSLAEVWISAPIFGLIIMVLAAANLNYLGVPVKFSAFLIVAASLVADFFIMRRVGFQTLSTGPLHPWLFGILVLCTALFLLPDVIHGAFSPFNDAVYYCSIADFVRNNSYFASTDSARTYPWMSQMLVARLTGARMGAQYFLAESSALSGIDGFTAFLPVTATGLFVSFCGFWLLARVLLPSPGAALFALAIYGTNVLFVHEAASLNWLSQTLAFGPLFALISFGIARESSWRSILAGGLLLAGLVSIYPEILPIAVVPIAIAVFLDLWNREQTMKQAVLRWAALLGISVAANPYAWFYTLRSVLNEFHATTLGFAFMNLSWLPVDIYFGLARMAGFSYSWVARGATLFGATLAVTALIGLLRLDRKMRMVIVASGAVYLALVWHQLYISHFVYSSQKILLYSFYLVPVCAGSGLAYLISNPRRSLPGGIGRAQAAIWICFVGWAFYRFTLDDYVRNSYPGMLAPIEQLASLQDLRALQHLIKPGQTTLIACPRDAYDRWIPYFFRQPVGDLYKSIYFASLAGETVTNPERYDYYLTLRPITSWKTPSEVLFENQLFSFSKAQTTLVVTNDGWHDVEYANGRPFQWMAKKGHVLLLAPESDALSVEAEVGLTDGATKHLHISLNGERLGDYALNSTSSKFSTAEFAVPAGSSDLVLETDESPHLYGNDPRQLNLQFHYLRIHSLAPLTLNLLDTEQTHFVQGLTEDRWVTDRGVEARFPNLGGSEAVLEMTGEAMTATAPGQISLQADDGLPVTQSIDRPGAFTRTFTLPMKAGQKSLRIRMLPARSVKPASLGVNSDVRDLAFRLTSLKLRK